MKLFCRSTIMSGNTSGLGQSPWALEYNTRGPLAHSENVAEGPPIPPSVQWVWRGEPTSAH